MDIVRSEAQDGGLFPVCLNYLGTLPDAVLHHTKWPARHPLGIYNLSLSKLLDAFPMVLEGIERESEHFRREQKFHDCNALLKAQKELLYALREHIDDCYSILRTFVEPAKLPQEGIRTELYLKHAKLPGLRKFDAATADYTYQYLGPLVNGLKHHHAQICSVVLYDRSNSDSARIGYYVEEAWEGEALGPSWRVHRDGNSGFSFSRDLHYNFYHVYEISERVLETIRAVCRAWHGLELVAGPAQDTKARWGSLARKVARLPLQPFPNEFAWPSPDVQLSEQESGGVLTLRLPSKVRHDWNPAELKVQITTPTDGTARAFKLPYWGKPKRPRRQ